LANPPTATLPANDGTAVAAREVSLALRNTLRLGVSLAVTFGVAFAVRFWMPRYLGPDTFGIVYFAEEYAAAFFVIGTLGFETYIHKEVATRPALASEVFGSVTAMRALVGLGILGVMALTLHGMGKGVIEWRLVALFAAGQMLFVHNNSLGALLQAVGKVDELAWIKAGAKVLWGVGIVVGLLLDRGFIEVVALSFLVTEALRTPLLTRAARRHLGLRFTLRWQAIRLVVAASLPYFLNYVAHSVYAKIAVGMLSYLTTDREVGWYGAAANVTAIVFLILPLLNAVVIPMGARIARDSEDAANATMRGTVRMVLILTVPMALLLALNAPVVVPLLFTERYLPSVATMQMLTPLVPLTYVCTMLGSHLIQVGRIWQVTVISLLGLLINPALNALTIVPVWHALGDGGAGVAAATTTVVTELVVAVALFAALGRASWDRALSALLVRLLLLCGALVGAHLWLQQLGLWAIPAEIVLYVALATPLGALPLRAMLGRVRQAQKRGEPTPSSFTDHQESR
jgi:O-antigen/teichoic acid export membrane protein